MRQGITKTLKLTFLATAAMGLMSQSPAFAQASPENSENSAGSEDKQPPTDTQEPEVSDEEGATSFATLCNNGQGKPDGSAVKKRRGIFGMADKMSALTRKIPLVGDFMVDSANSLSQSFACRLYPEEQKQAAEATQEATRSPEIGKKVEWTSTVRKNVSGSSIVSAKNELANGTSCLIMFDVVIIDGEETKVSKQMCRLPGSPRYKIVAA